MSIPFYLTHSHSIGCKL